LVGRSYGGNIVHLLLTTKKEIAAHTRAMVLIAPAVDVSEVDEDIENLPVMLVWSKDDPILRFAPERVTDAYQNVTPCYFDKVIPEGEADHWGHSPENMKPVEFQSALKAFVSKL
jgi:pimeloyl-ACP methyl ester carboxylesterase